MGLLGITAGDDMLLPRNSMTANEIAAASAGKPLGFAGKSRVGLSPRPGVAEFGGWA